MSSTTAYDEALALRALTAFGLSGAYLTLLGTSDNTVLRVDPPTGPPLVLRLHTAPDLDARAVRSELVWLDSLRGVGDGLFPQPHRSPSGELLVVLGEGGGPGFASLLSWVEGEVTDGPLNVAQARQAGERIATLHRHAESFVPPPEFERPRYDLASFRHNWQELQRLLGPQGLPAEQAARIAAGWPIFGALLDPMSGVPGGFGLVHGDAHPGNFVWQSGQLRVIDFGRLGWSAFLYDIAYAVLDFEPPERAAFMEGYRGVRSLPDMVQPHLRALMILSALDNLAFLARRPHEHPFILGALPHVEDAVAKLLAEAGAT